ncbi:MAG: response regulator [Tannerellaceae bacterium]|jgi:ligand-binding sensor domain-containing protein/DNA-binding response OmpR family regulator|nr:response regulator [Tannerellaceae bacterium]
MKERFILLAFFLLPVAWCCRARQSRFYGRGELTCNLITDMCRDSNGFIWIGTANGLNKFDGWTFTHYFHKETNESSLLSNYVYSLCVDSKKTLWIGTNRSLQRYLPYEDAFRPVHFPHDLQPSVEDIIELHTGEIWIATSGKGVFAVDRQSMTAVEMHDVNRACGNLLLDNIYEDSSHTIWIPVPPNKVLRITAGEVAGNAGFQMLEAPGFIHSFAEDDKGRLFASFQSGIGMWEPLARKFIPLKNLAGHLLKPKILCGRKGIVYVGTFGRGLGYIDPQTLEIRKMSGIENRDINLEKIKVESLIEDRDGNLWAGCFRKGLLMVPNESSLFDFRDFSDMEHQSGDCISSIYKDSEGIVWAGAENGEMMKVHEDGRIAASYPAANAIASLFEDSDHTFWVGTGYGGLLQFDRSSGSYRHTPGTNGAYIKSIVEDKEKNVYFSIFGGGFMQYSLPTRKRRLIAENTPTTGGRSLKNNFINKLMTDSKGRIWAGHYKGVDCYDPQADTFLKLGCDSALRTTICYSLLEDSLGTVWMGTNNGLFGYHHESGRFVHYSTDDGLPDNVICGLVKDRRGNIWCSTFRGICRIHCRDGVMYSYLSGSGLFDREYSRGVYFQCSEGEAYFGGVYGITRFIPDSIQNREIAAEPMLTLLALNNRPVSAHTFSGGRPISHTVFSEASALHLSYRDNTFAMDFSMMNYRDPENILYEYRLEGANDEWYQTATGSNRIIYNRLPPGNYMFHIRACDNGVYSPVKSFAIIITPPWYASPAAKAGYTVLLLGFIGTFCYFLHHWLRKVHQEEINEEKLKFFINISHEIRSPMTLIISPLTMLMKKDYDEATLKAFRSMYRNANRIVRLLNQLLDIRRIDKGQMKMTCSEVNLVSFIEELLGIFEYQADKRAISLRFEHAAEYLPAWIDRNNFDKVLINLLDNAFKFTPEGGEITLSLECKVRDNRKGHPRSYAEISIKDSGIGLDEKNSDRIFERFYQDSPLSSSGSGIGLNLCKTLIELHHGAITAGNRKETQGSCFTITIPLGNEHLGKDEMVAQDFSPRLALEQNMYCEMEPHTKQSGRKTGTGYKILVIDDDREICHYLQQELISHYRVITCSNGTEGLQKALDTLPDLIVSDVIMAGMDGFTLLKKIKTNANISHIPVILLTSQAEYGNRMKGWDKGADAILTKPFNLEELLLLCSNLIAGRRHLKGKFAGFQDQKEKVKPVELKSNDEQLIERLMSAINRNMGNPHFNVELLAEEAGISRVQLHRKLKEIAGIPAGEFIRNIRLKQAATLLKTRKTNISQVAYAVGYTNPSLFSVAFKKFYGFSPTEYLDKTSGDAGESIA